MVDPAEDHPHPVPPQAFMTWKENWVFPLVDREAATAALFHVSLRPASGEGIFTAKFHVRGQTLKHVGRSPIPSDVTSLRPIADATVSVAVEEEGRRFRLQHDGPDVRADLSCTARWPAWDFHDGPRVAGSVLGDIGNAVFPFHHYEQPLEATGTIEVRSGKLAGEVVDFSGWGNRDHSWGWRDDFQFRRHHWLCASFSDRHVQGSVMLEASHPSEKVGGYVASDAGNEAVVAVDTTSAWSLASAGPLGIPEEDLTYRVRTASGAIHELTAHLGHPYGRLHLNARSSDRAEIYEDLQTFCDITHLGTGERGVGVLELGKYSTGPGVADRYGRPPADRGAPS